MSNEEDNRAGLVPSQSAALSPAGVSSPLVRRGVQDLLARAEAEQWHKQGRAFWHRHQYGEGTECFRRGLQLDPNHAALQFYFGVAYYVGKGVPQDYVEATFWWHKAAEQGHTDAQFNLGFCYVRGDGVPKNDPEALYWWRKAAEQGEPCAAYNLGCCYQKGEGVPQHYIQAAFWYRKAAQGIEDAWADYHEVLNRLALEGDSDSNAVYVNLDNLLTLDEMLRKAGLDGVKGWGLEKLRSSLDEQQSNTRQ